MSRICTVLLVAILFTALVPGAAQADRTQVYAISGIDCSGCGALVARSVQKVKGVKTVQFDPQSAVVAVAMSDDVADDAIAAAVRRAGPGFEASPGAGQGHYMPFPVFPAGSDVALVSEHGEVVGPLDSLRVPQKSTVLDVYAEWCMPCRELDAALAKLAGKRPDVAFRRLNIGRLESPLAEALGPSAQALPYIVVLTKDGHRVELPEATAKQVMSALKPK